MRVSVPNTIKNDAPNDDKDDDEVDINDNDYIPSRF